MSRRPRRRHSCRCRSCLVQSLLRARRRILRGENADREIAAEIVDIIAWDILNQPEPAAICIRGRRIFQEACRQAVPLVIASNKAA